MDFFLARRRVPAWAVCLSFLATEISAVTIISVPATAYSENWEYVQFFVGSSLAKLGVAYLFIPAFYRHEVTTIYEFLAYRFGQASQVTASIFFFVTRLAGSGVRVAQWRDRARREISSKSNSSRASRRTSPRRSATGLPLSSPSWITPVTRTRADSTVCRGPMAGDATAAPATISHAANALPMMTSSSRRP